ncbi:MULTISPECIES: rhomboid family intramembrane serine protease [Bacillus]|uniref:rhomboid family intramembrane serine protease n=1 Tax=Bacillus TaxID=1386 RepID=UPI00031EE858|nr:MULTISPECIES: rhomboid family intramembrane serine protease [Bacillus]
MSFNEDYLFWRTIRTLTQEYGYSMITMSESQNEVWLEDNKNSNSVIRLMRIDFDWAIALKKDLNRTALVGENIRKKLFKKPISIINLYFTKFKPVDDYAAYETNQIKNNKTTISTTIIDSLSFKEGLQKVEEKLQINLEQVKVIPEDISEENIAQLKNSAIQASLEKRQEEQNMFQYGKPFLTKVFLAIQIIIFIAMEIVGSSESNITLVEFGAKYNPLILDGEWWRFIMPIFIHIGFLHILMNSVALYYIGSEVERLYGSIRFFFIYLFAGFAGVLASFIFSTNISAGASGAIFGCFGALLYFGIAHPKLFLRAMGTNIIVLIVINLLMGFIISEIDNAGHIGGLLGGFAAAAVVGLPKAKKPLFRIFGGVALVLVTIFLLNYGFDKQRNANQDVALASLAQEYINKGENEKAKKILLSSINNDIISPNAYFFLGNFSIDEKDFDQAQKYYKKAIELNPEFHQAHFNLALTYLQNNEVSEAKKHVDKALELNPNDEAYTKVSDQIKAWLQQNK